MRKGNQVDGAKHNDLTETEGCISRERSSYIHVESVPFLKEERIARLIVQEVKSLHDPKNTGRTFLAIGLTRQAAFDKARSNAITATGFDAIPQREFVGGRNCVGNEVYFAVIVVWDRNYSIKGAWF